MKDQEKYKICQLCGIQTKNARSLTVHLNKKHNYNTDKQYEDYYNTYLKEPSDGICPICGKQTQQTRFTYRQFCCKSCASKSAGLHSQESIKAKYGVSNISQLSSTKQKVKQTKKDRYGDENYTNKEKRLRTNIERYGCTNPLANKEIVSKIKQTHISKYNGWYTSTPEYKEKAVQTNQLKYNSDWYSQTNERNNRLKETYNKQYGVDHLVKSDYYKDLMIDKYGNDYEKSIREKGRQTNLQRYGSLVYSKSEDYKSKWLILVERTQQTNLQKYGSLYYTQSDEYKKLLPEIKQRIEQINTEKYGTPYYTQSDEYKKLLPQILIKTEQTNLKKYGATHYCLSDEYRDLIPKIKLKIEQTSIQRYGATHYCLSDEYKELLPKIKLKIEQINTEKYGTPYYTQSDEYKKLLPEIKLKIEQINIEKYGTPYYTQSDEYKELLPKIKLKIEQSNLSKYGVTHPLKLDFFKRKIRKTNIEKYGVPFYSQTDEFKTKCYNTKKINNTFSTSKPEEKLNEILNELYPGDVVRQYKCERYPHSCDFYIKSLDVFIEGQFSWTHGYLPFNEQNPQCVSSLNKISTKTKSLYYKSAKTVWIEKDVIKRNTAFNNNLNYIELFDVDCLNNECVKEIVDYCLENKYVCDYKKDEHPLYLYFSTDELNNEFESFKNKKGNLSKCPNQNKIVKFFQQENFYREERELFLDDKIRYKLIENRKKYLKKDNISPSELLNGFRISGIHKGFSHFNPLWTKYFVEEFNCKYVYDPCGGWGHHLLGMVSKDDVKVIYNDINVDTYKGVESIVHFLNKGDVVEMINEDGSKYVPKQQIDSMFMCPPYFNKEIYNEDNCFANINEYRMFIYNICNIFINSSANIFGVILNKEYMDFVKEDLKEMDIIFETEINSNTNHFSRKKTSNDLNKEYFTVFKKIIKNRTTNRKIQRTKRNSWILG